MDEQRRDQQDRGPGETYGQGQGRQESATPDTDGDEAIGGPAEGMKRDPDDLGTLVPDDEEGNR